MTDEEAMEALFQAIHRQAVEEGKETLPYEEWRKHVIVCGRPKPKSLNYRKMGRGG